MDYYYTAQEARTHLNIKDNRFHYLVRRGDIPSILLPGRRYKVYPKTEVDRFSVQLKASLGAYIPETSVLLPATQDDLQEEYVIDRTILGTRAIASIEERQQRQQRVKDGNFVLWNDGERVGYICYCPIARPLLQEIMESRVTGQRSAPPLSLDKFLSFSPGRPLDIYIFMIAVKPGFPPNVERYYGMRLITGMLEHFNQLAAQGVNIEHVYAASWTPSGIHLCRKLGMKGKQYVHEPGRWMFSLHLPSSPLVQCLQTARAKKHGPLRQHRTKDVVQFAFAQPEDMEQIDALAVRLFHRKAIGADLRRSWLAKEPRGNYVMKRISDGKIMAYLYILPMSHENIENYLNRRLRGWLISEKDILPFVPGVSTECYVGAIGTTPDVPKSVGSSYMSMLLRGVRTDLERLGREGITISTIYSASSNFEGSYLCLHLGMKLWEPPNKNRLKFVLDIQESDSFLFEPYKRALAAWQNRGKNRIDMPEKEQPQREEERTYDENV